MATPMNTFLQEMPKAELHVHLEGTIPAAMVLSLAKRNGVDIPYDSEAALVAAQDYPEPALVNFLNYHYLCSDVLRTGQDIYDVTQNYLAQCNQENIRHAEISFDPQPHLERGIGFDELIEAMDNARRDALSDHGVSSQFIMCMNRERSEEDALAILKLASRYRDSIVGVGLDSYEKDNPPIKFLAFYKQAKEQGYRLTAHCDCNQENATLHIHQCLHDLSVERIDHGLHCLDDSSLHTEVKARGITLTMCPTWRPSDPAPRRVAALREMLTLGLPVTVNSDDPEEFASRYLTNIVIAVQREGEFSAREMTQFMRNAFEGSWITESQRQSYVAELDSHLSAYEASGLEN